MGLLRVWFVLYSLTPTENYCLYKQEGQSVLVLGFCINTNKLLSAAPSVRAPAILAFSVPGVCLSVAVVLQGSVGAEGRGLCLLKHPI